MLVGIGSPQASIPDGAAYQTTNDNYRYTHLVPGGRTAVIAASPGFSGAISWTIKLDEAGFSANNTEIQKIGKYCLGNLLSVDVSEQYVSLASLYYSLLTLLLWWISFIPVVLQWLVIFMTCTIVTAFGFHAVLSVRMCHHIEPTALSSTDADIGIDSGRVIKLNMVEYAENVNIVKVY